MRVFKSSYFDGIEKFLEVNKETLQQFEYENSNFQSLTLDFIAQNLKNLISLKITCTNSYHYPIEILDITSGNQKLEELSIIFRNGYNTSGNICDILKYYSSIKKLNFVFKLKVNENHAREVCNPNLKFLHVPTADHSLLTFSRFDNLETLHIDKFQFKAEIAINQSVKFLYIDYSDANIQRIALFYPSMEFLQVKRGNGSWKLNKISIKRALSFAKRLKVLEISSHLCSVEEQTFRQLKIKFID